MLLADALKVFGTKAAISAALGLSGSAVYQWDKLVPPLQAAKLAALDRRLVFDPSVYDGWNGQRRRKNA